MKLEELLSVIPNEEPIYIYIWDTQKELFHGLNLEYDKNLSSLYEKIVLICSYTNEFMIGVKE